MPNFNEVFKELSRDYRNQNLEYAIESWYLKANFSEGEIEEINAYRQALLQQQEFLVGIKTIYKTLLKATNRKIPLPINWVGDFLIDNLKLSGKLGSIASNTQQEIRMDTKLVLLVALGLAGIGFIAYQTQKTKDRAGSGTPAQRSTPPSAALRSSTTSYPAGSIPRTNQSQQKTSQQKTFLFLVLKTYKVSEEIINSLKNSGITSTIVDQAFSITAIEALWQGTDQDYSETNLDSDLKKPGVKTPSASDVYLVKIELDQRYPQFERNSDRMIRYEAFEEMIGTKPKITISKRLAVTDYNPAVLYR